MSKPDPRPSPPSPPTQTRRNNSPSPLFLPNFGPPPAPINPNVPNAPTYTTGIREGARAPEGSGSGHFLRRTHTVAEPIVRDTHTVASPTPDDNSLREFLARERARTLARREGLGEDTWTHTEQTERMQQDTHTPTNLVNQETQQQRSETHIRSSERLARLNARYEQLAADIDGDRRASTARRAGLANYLNSRSTTSDVDDLAPVFRVVRDASSAATAAAAAAAAATDSDTRLADLDALRSTTTVRDRNRGSTRRARRSASFRARLDNMASERLRLHNEALRHRSPPTTAATENVSSTAATIGAINTAVTAGSATLNTATENSSSTAATTRTTTTTNAPTTTGSSTATTISENPSSTAAAAAAAASTRSTFTGTAATARTAATAATSRPSTAASRYIPPSAHLAVPPRNLQPRATVIGTAAEQRARARARRRDWEINIEQRLSSLEARLAVSNASTETALRTELRMLTARANAIRHQLRALEAADNFNADQEWVHFNSLNHPNFTPDVSRDGMMFRNLDPGTLFGTMNPGPTGEEQAWGWPNPNPNTNPNTNPRQSINIATTTAAAAATTRQATGLDIVTVPSVQGAFNGTFQPLRPAHNFSSAMPVPTNNYTAPVPMPISTTTTSTTTTATSATQTPAMTATAHPPWSSFFAGTPGAPAPIATITRFPPPAGLPYAVAMNAIDPRFRTQHMNRARNRTEWRIVTSTYPATGEGEGEGEDDDGVVIRAYTASSSPENGRSLNDNDTWTLFDEETAVESESGSVAGSVAGSGDGPGETTRTQATSLEELHNTATRGTPS